MKYLSAKLVMVEDPVLFALDQELFLDEEIAFHLQLSTLEY
jgi:hypothetical protein